MSQSVILGVEITTLVRVRRAFTQLPNRGGDSVNATAIGNGTLTKCAVLKMVQYKELKQQRNSGTGIANERPVVVLEWQCAYAHDPAVCPLCFAFKQFDSGCRLDSGPTIC